MAEPCIKGITLQSVVEDVRLLRDSARISQEELAARLQERELAWLRDGVQPSLWYSIEGYTRLSELLLEVEGRGDPEYLVRRGAAAAERLYASGLYAQLRHGEERRSEERAGGREFSEKDGRLMTTLSGAVFNFGKWSYREDGDDIVIEVTNAAAMPEVSRLAAHGFIAHIASRVRDAKIEVRSSRPALDHIVFRFENRREA
jgi:hypothetical protein